MDDFTLEEHMGHRL